MVVLVSAGMLGEIRQFAASARDHTYTRIATVGAVDGNLDPILDGWGHQLTQPGTPQPGRPCKYVVLETIARDERGTVLTRTPQLWLGPDDDLAPGDQVADVGLPGGPVLLASATVRSIEPGANVDGGLVERVASLDGAESVVEPPGVSGP